MLENMPIGKNAFKRMFMIEQRINLLRKDINHRTESIQLTQTKIQEMQYRRYKDIRRSQPEFRGISDKDLTSYINLYRRNISEGFEPLSQELTVMGGISLFLSWLFFNAGSA
jgi:ammonia channel protein AmtB